MSILRATIHTTCLLAACFALNACNRPAYGEFNQSDASRRSSAAGSGIESGAVAGKNGVLEALPVQEPTLTRDTDTTPSNEYIIGPRDELMIEVSPHENAGVPQNNGGGEGGIGGGSSSSSANNATMGTGNRTGITAVHDDGTIQLLGVGTFHAAGMTITQLSEVLKKEFTKIINDPEVLIEIKTYKSQIVYLSGQFGKPGPMFLERRTDMLQLISLAGNPASGANVRGAYVMRKNKEGKYKMLNVDLYSLLEEGDISQNIWIHPDDFLYIPDNTKQVVFMQGNIGHPGPLPLEKDGTLSLLRAVSMAGDVKSFGTDWNKFRIIRSISPMRGEFIVVDFQKIRDGEVPDFQLRAGDVVYIANSRLGDWNEAIQAIAPSFTAIGNATTPFVQYQLLKNSLNGK